MKLRSIMAACAACAASVAFATGEVTSDTTFGILKLADNESTNLLISVPWTDCESGGNVLVSNLVMTTNLADGDWLVAKNGATYYGWKLEDGVWKAASEISGSGITVTLPASEVNVGRGTALMLHRNNPAGCSPIYFYGRYNSAAATTTISKGVTTLCANPTSTDLSLSSLKSGEGGKFTSGGPANGDRVIVNTAGGVKTYTYIDGKWRTITRERVGAALPPLPGMSEGTYTYNTTVTTNDASSASITAGKGFWYQSTTNGGSSSSTITW